MNRKSIILAAVAAISLSLSGAAFAAPEGAPETQAPAVETTTKSPAEIYDLNHKGAVTFLTQFRDAITTVPEIAGALAQLPTELAKLPGLEKAYIDAKNAGNEADAAKAQDTYTATVQKIIELALPLDQNVMPMRVKIMSGFDQLGAIGTKLKAEKDIAALIAEIDRVMKPLDDANTLVGPLHDAAAQNTNTRVQLEGKRIFAEELRAQISNLLQTRLAQ